VCRLVSVELTADSTPAAVQQAAARAVAEAAREAGTIRLEPMVQVEVTTTEEHLGTVLSDLNANRRGEIGELATLPDGRRVAHATVALATMVGYASALRSSTKGASSFHMAFSHFAPE
jgi:elongation factor G